jgi:hypothetical protein
MTEDLRDKNALTPQDVFGLNFIRAPGPYAYRRHFRAGLRSHIMEVLDPGDLEKERRGTIVDGVKSFPRAKPLKMLRLFRTKFQSLQQAREELARVKAIEAYLAPDHLALSNEFLVDYHRGGTYEILLCGLQEYVEGEILDPWRHLDEDHLTFLWSRIGRTADGVSDMEITRWVETVRSRTRAFVHKTKRMIREVCYIPDLAGVGNILITPAGNLKIVDINNISCVRFDSEIRIDDRGYPVCDKSVEALFHIERQMVGEMDPGEDPLFRVFLDPARMERVRAIEETFHASIDLPPILERTGNSRKGKEG